MLGIRLKYIILDGVIPVIFPEGVEHSQIASGTNMEVTSAGFVSLVPISSSKERPAKINATVSGESITLDKKSQGDKDNSIIERVLND